VAQRTPPYVVVIVLVAVRLLLTRFEPEDLVPPFSLPAT
jgi:hypothetical protein